MYTKPSSESALSCPCWRKHGEVKRPLRECGAVPLLQVTARSGGGQGAGPERFTGPRTAPVVRGDDPCVHVVLPVECRVVSAVPATAVKQRGNEATNRVRVCTH